MKKHLIVFIFLSLFGIVSCDKKDKEVATENQIISTEENKLSEPESQIISNEQTEHSATENQTDNIQEAKVSNVTINGKEPFKVNYAKIEQERLEMERNGTPSELTGFCFEVFRAREEMTNHNLSPENVALAPGQTLTDNHRAQLEMMKKSEIEGYKDEYSKMPQADCQKALEFIKTSVFVE